VDPVRRASSHHRRHDLRLHGRGGDLYLGYRFDHLDVYEYKADDASRGTVLVELYWMQTSDDAFGLLSTDWTGQAVTLGPPPGPTAHTGMNTVPPHHGLYGAGLLRLWSGNLFARVLASRETPAARDAVCAIGRALAVGPSRLRQSSWAPFLTMQGGCRPAVPRPGTSSASIAPVSSARIWC
jgi:hypothetical protein